MLRSPNKSFVAGFVCASLFFGSWAVATEVGEKQISVFYNPLKYYFDGVEKAPPEDQQGFVYNNRTYVPLRFMSEALGKTVNYDPATFSIYVGRRTSPLPAFYSGFRTRGEGSTIVTYFEEGARTVRGIEMPRSVLIAAKVLPASQPTPAEPTSEFDITYKVPEEVTTLSGTLFVPESYWGDPEERKIAKLVVLSQTNLPIFEGDIMNTNSANLPFKVKIRGNTQVRILLVLYPHSGILGEDGFLTTEIGISDLKAE